MVGLFYKKLKSSLDFEKYYKRGEGVASFIKDGPRSWSGPFPFKRTIHNIRQVMNPSELKIGNKYKKVYSHLPGQEILVELISTKPDKKGFIRVKEIFSPESIFEGTLALEDCGIIPYCTGVWNPTNYLIPAN